ncbi:alpha/beta hydrolase [Sporosarcina sp. FSL W7-1349]|uniref:alpha/beta fold hydrolase n=1 Tax=Sporosarcina sp. FSL W7-1349 TaxID=2921561 RepID=UPI0030F8F132
MITEVNGCSIYYEIFGEENTETIFFIHGAPGLGDCRSDIKAFSSLSKNFRLVFLDMRGSGRSADVPPYTHEQWTADIDELRKQVGVDKIHILGGSYGGFLALEYAIRYPDQVLSVMLRDTAANNNSSEDSINRALEANLKGLNEDNLVRLFQGKVRTNEELKDTFFKIQPLYTVEYDEEKTREKIDSIYYHYATHNYAFSENKKTYDISEDIKSIKVPVLITVGIHDWITPVESSDLLAKNIPDNTYIKFENSGHSPHIEENEKYLEHVREFLSSVTAKQQ